VSSFRILFALVTLLLGAACPTNNGKLMAMGSSGGPIETCVVGAWFGYGPGGKCDCPKGFEQPECSASDCTTQNLTLFVPNQSDAKKGKLYFGSISFSNQLKTWSSQFKFDESTYEFDGNFMIFDGKTNQKQLNTCTKEQLVVGEFVLKLRASATETQLLTKLITGGGVWVSQPKP
jgi:hypothetical protein